MAHMKRILALFGFLAVFPFFLSRRSRVTRSVWIAVPPAGVFPFVNGLRNWDLWTAWSRREAVETYCEGPDAGQGSTQRWATKFARGATRITGSVPDRCVTYSVEMCDGRRTFEGAITLEPSGTGTRIVWSCSWLGGENPYLRYVDLGLKCVLTRDFDAGLSNLKQVVEGAIETEAASL